MKKFSLSSVVFLLPSLAAGGFLLYIPFQYWMNDPRNQDYFKLLLPYYPVLFLFLFTSEENRQIRPIEMLIFTIGILFVLIGSTTGLLFLIWPGSYWLLLISLQVSGIRFFLPAYALVFLTPPFNTALEILFGFPLRIVLTKMTASLLMIFDRQASFSGNTILYRERSFTVDPACEGLKMFTALVILVLYLIFNELKHANVNKSKKLFKIFFFYMIPGFIFWINTNLIRIVILVIGNIPPESPMHELTGIVLFITSSVAPLFLIRKFFFNINTDTSLNILYSDIKYKKTCSKIITFSHRAAASGTIAFFMIFAATWAYLSPRIPESENLDFENEIAGFQRTEDSKAGDKKIEDIATYKNGKMRLILKRNLNPVKIGHHPKLCWTGVGYKFFSESQILLKENEPVFGDIRLTLLERNNNNKKEYYALLWWYQPAVATSAEKSPLGETLPSFNLNTFIGKDASVSKNVTASEFSWRKRRILHGETFQQINVFIPLNNRNEFKNISEEFNEKITNHSLKKEYTPYINGILKVLAAVI